MAANSTLQALQYAAGVPAPGCQLRRNLVTKPHKTTIMAAIPAMKIEATVLVCTLHPLRPSSYRQKPFVTKRDKTIVAAYPELRIDIVPGVPIYTNVELKNSSGLELKLDDKVFWAGPRAVDLPKNISIGETFEFKHEADSQGSIGALEYVFGEREKYKWVIAWSNAKDALNKVYTEILKDDADWNEIKESLSKSTETCEFIGPKHQIPYSSKVEIDRTSAKPTMKATLTVRYYTADTTPTSKEQKSQ
ncbi:hypothetical protein PTKIN_Ptkin16aG0059100 [Pterospermum kingtungense]